jgi:hypothetical protein
MQDTAAQAGIINNRDKDRGITSISLGENYQSMMDRSELNKDIGVTITSQSPSAPENTLSGHDHLYACWSNNQSIIFMF